jgi:hypothetical protein
MENCMFYFAYVLLMPVYDTDLIFVEAIAGDEAKPCKNGCEDSEHETRPSTVRKYVGTCRAESMARRRHSLLLY